MKEMPSWSDSGHELRPTYESEPEVPADPFDTFEIYTSEEIKHMINITNRDRMAGVQLNQLTFTDPAGDSEVKYFISRSPEEFAERVAIVEGNAPTVQLEVETVPLTDKHMIEDDIRLINLREGQRPFQSHLDHAINACDGYQDELSELETTIANIHAELLALNDENDPGSKKRTAQRATLEESRKKVISYEEQIPGLMQQAFSRLASELKLVDDKFYGDQNKQRRIRLDQHESLPPHSRYLASRLMSMFRADPRVESEMQFLYGDNFEKFSTEKFASDITNKIIKTDLMLQMAHDNREIARQEQEQFYELVEKVREEFKSEVQAAVADGWLPAAVLENLHRIDTATITYMDTFGVPNTRSLGTNQSHGLVTAMSVSLHDQPRTRHILFHELTHEIAGQGYSARNGAISRHKSGVFTSRKQRWLNEAITERIASRLSGYQRAQVRAGNRYDIYTEEQRKFNEIVANDVDLEQVAYKAYFENITHDQPANEKAQLLKTFIDGVNQKLGPHGWTRTSNEFLVNNELRGELWFPLHREASAKSALQRPASPEGAVWHVGKVVAQNKGGNEKARYQNEFFIVDTSVTTINVYYDRLRRRADAIGVEVSELAMIDPAELLDEDSASPQAPAEAAE